MFKRNLILADYRTHHALRLAICFRYYSPHFVFLVLFFSVSPFVRCTRNNSFIVRWNIYYYPFRVTCTFFFVSFICSALWASLSLTLHFCFFSRCSFVLIPYVMARARVRNAYFHSLLSFVTVDGAVSYYLGSVADKWHISPFSTRKRTLTQSHSHTI